MANKKTKTKASWHCFDLKSFCSEHGRVPNVIFCFWVLLLLSTFWIDELHRHDSLSFWDCRDLCHILRRAKLALWEPRGGDQSDPGACSDWPKIFPKNVAVCSVGRQWI